MLSKCYVKHLMLCNYRLNTIVYNRISVSDQMVAGNFNLHFYITSLPLVAKSWWRHQMETFSALLALCAGNSPVPVNSPHKGQWRGALMFSFIYAWINDWVNNREAGDLRRQDGHYDVIVMCYSMMDKETTDKETFWLHVPLEQHHVTIFMSMPKLLCRTHFQAPIFMVGL